MRKSQLAGQATANGAEGRNNGRREVSAADVARTANVSVGTVSRVMNRRPDVNPELRKRVLVASRKLGFVPKVQHRCMAVITGRMSPVSPVGYVTTMMALVAKHLAARKYTMELVDVENLELAYQAHVQGAIGIVFDERIATLREIPNLPVLTLNRPMTGHGIHSVCADHFQQGEMATRYLLSHGHRRIGFLENASGNWGSDQRLAGYRRSLEGAGVEFDASLVDYPLGKPLYDALARLVNRGITAILNFSEDNALETIHILTNILRLSIPRDISVITMEDLPVFQYLTPPQTVIRQPLEEVARVGVSETIGLCGATEETKRETIDIMLRSELIERDSVRRIG